MSATDIASIIVTIGLLIVTYAYTHYTAAMVRPHLQAAISYEKTDTLFFTIYNTGKGPAHDIQAEWVVDGEENEPREWESEIIPSGEHRRFAIPLGSIGSRYTDVGEVSEAVKQLEGDSEIQFEATCDSLAGWRRKEFNQTISIQGALKRIDAAEEFSVRTPIESVAEDVQNIQSILQNFE